MKNLTWQNPEQLFVAQELINKVKSKCCGIKVYEDSNEKISLKYDPNTQFITFWGDGIKYDQMDCSFFSDWDSVLKELYSEYGINLLD